jgi:hypothetical protein
VKRYIRERTGAEEIKGPALRCMASGTIDREDRQTWIWYNRGWALFCVAVTFATSARASDTVGPRLITLDMPNSTHISTV